MLEDFFRQFFEWAEGFSVQHGYIGVFLLSMAGALSIFFPIPYTVVLFTLGGSPDFDPIMLALSSCVGSAVGELSGYALGLSGRKAVSEKRKRKIELLIKMFGKYVPLTVFVFALTPLPDDLLFIPLGVMRYTLWRAFLPALIGKFCMSLTVVYGGRLSIYVIRDVFGVESDWVSALISTALAVALLAVALVLMFKVDWEKYVLRKGIHVQAERARHHY